MVGEPGRAGKNGEAAQAARAARARGRTATESQKAVASEKEDELDDALGDLNSSTNRLRRRVRPHRQVDGDAAAGGKRPG